MIFLNVKCGNLNMTFLCFTQKRILELEPDIIVIIVDEIITEEATYIVT